MQRHSLQHLVVDQLLHCLCLAAEIKVCQLSSLHACMLACMQSMHSNDSWDWCELSLSCGPGQRLRPCSVASARRRPVSREARGALLDLTLPLLVAALRQLHQQKLDNLAGPSDLQGL